jgi:hypothetical protein
VRHLLALLLFPLVAVAAPVPKETEKQKMTRLFGEVADAPKGYDFTLDGDKLVVTMAANSSKSLDEFSPRTEREVTGDFDVRVVLTFAPSKKQRKEAGPSPHLVAGLGLWGKGERVLLRGPYFGDTGSEKNADGWGYGEWTFYQLSADEATSAWALNRSYRKYERRHLRLRREEGKYKYGESVDGKEWDMWAAEPCDLPDTVRVGVYAVNTTNAECAATFSDLTVIPIKPAEKK